MAGTALTTLDTYVEDYADGVTNEADILLRATVRTFRDFCEWTHCWKETLDDIDVSEDVNSYALTPGTDNCDSPNIIGLDSAQFKEDGEDDNQYHPIDIKSREYMDDYEAGWENRDSAPVPYRCFYDELDGKIYLIDTPSADSTDGLKVRVWLEPALDATTAPGFMFTKYQEALTFGIVGKLLRMTNQRWSNPELGDYYHSLYIAERDNAQQEVDRGRGNIKNYHVKPELAFTGGSKNRFRGFSGGGVFNG
jgi:hypothetical protein